MSEARIAWEDSHGRLWQGDVRACLAAMPERSVQVAACSPPYHGLRAYGTDPQLWGGDSACTHQLEDAPSLPPMTGGSGALSSKQVSNAGSQFGNAWVERRVVYSDAPGSEKQASNRGANGDDAISASCVRCGCWRGELGSEPTVEQFVANLVEVFAAMRRVLRDDGLLWINLGSSYAGSGKGPTGHNGIGDQERRQGFSTSKGARIGSVNGESGHTSGVRPTDGYKAKDLIQTPFLLFHALQRDGWWLRSVAPWIKRNGMPESCTDRPTHSLEWIGLFSKSERYFYDPEAGRVPLQASTLERTYTPAYFANQAPKMQDAPSDVRAKSDWRANAYVPNGRNRRNTDWYFDGLDAEITAAEADLRYLRDLRANGGVRLGDDGLPLAFDVNPQGTAIAHFATWPANLVKPMIALSTSERGACAACGAPHKRVTKPTPEYQAVLEAGRQTDAWKGERRAEAIHIGVAFGDKAVSTTRAVETTGWAPTCTCDCPETRPCVVLDCFSGSGTTLAVARSLGRFGLGVELSEPYCAMAIKRLRQRVLF